MSLSTTRACLGDPITDWSVDSSVEAAESLVIFGTAKPREEAVKVR
jgi:hypothetical protein